MPAQEDEKFFKIALLSRALQVHPIDGIPQPLVKRRKVLAKSLWEQWKKDAFGQVDDNQTAHDLAIGLLLAWLPVFVIATIVDRNQIGADAIRRKLNEFVEDVRKALLDPGPRSAFLKHYGRQEDDLAWPEILQIDDFFHDGFFARFAGQERI
ncbi:MAG: hypothetical protein Q9209_000556 [Squamulea sp. 1 TL-2023]